MNIKELIEVTNSFANVKIIHNTHTLYEGEVRDFKRIPNQDQYVVYYIDATDKHHLEILIGTPEEASGYPVSFVEEE